jgi:tetratricopeptide (TPR) repeat protein
MDGEHNKMMYDLQRLLKTQQFNSKEEMEAFLKNLKGKKIPEFPQESLTDEEKAQDLIFAAWDLPPYKAKKKIEEALELDPFCIEAYEWLGINEDNTAFAIAFFNRGVTIGRRRFGGEFMKTHKGHFWYMHETRPFMRCLEHYAECLYELGEERECVEIMEEILVLNKNDNQGVRYQLMLYLLELREMEKFEKYAKKFKSDGSAFFRFNLALYAFFKYGDTAESVKLLHQAIESNPHVVPFLRSRKPVLTLPDSYSLGSEEEARIYVFYSQPIWHSNPPALQWLLLHS